MKVTYVIKDELLSFVLIVALFYFHDMCPVDMYECVVCSL